MDAVREKVKEGPLVFDWIYKYQYEPLIFKNTCLLALSPASTRINDILVMVNTPSFSF